jgi:hypothetical protein
LVAGFSARFPGRFGNNLRYVLCHILYLTLQFLKSKVAPFGATLVLG